MESMTRERLERYRNIRAEIRELRSKLDNLLVDDSAVRASVILDYKTGYPKPQTVVGRDYDLVQRRRKRYEDQIGRLMAEQDNIEAWVFGIPDTQLRRIFRLYFLEGMSQEKVARKVHMDKSNVSRKIEKFLKSQQMQQKI